MNKNQFQIHLDKKNLTLTAEQLVFYKQSKVLEATDKNANYYYLIFYKNDFINGAKRKQIKINSHIHHAFTKGIHFKGSHPITSQLLQNHKSFHLITFNQLYKNIQKSFPKLETALVISYFDSFTKTGSVEKLFKRTYYEYRRNGQNLNAYQLLKTYNNVGRESKFAHDMMHDMQLSQYGTLYQNMKEVYEKDPINFESASFDDLFRKKESRELLLQLYKEQNRPLDELAVRTAMLRYNFSKSNFEAILTMLTDLSEKAKIRYLQELKQTPAVKEELMNVIMASDNANDVSDFLMSTKLMPPDDQIENIIQNFEQADANVLSTYFKKSNKRLLKLSKGDAHKMEKLIKPFVSAFLEDYRLSDILDWLEPFREAGHQLPIERKLLKMKKLTEDPDQQFALGELYIQFRQLEKSIDCFKWEMELHPEDQKPVTYLSKIYQELGDKEEAAAYQQLLIQMNR
ncbi:tetratricopeptide repeat protein [Oceanobacillus longus]|uniref:Tetratricopeptide repeat protein n=1 Tax=Oceanobacillus longus TaxID=930120 RepID=A0ABV8H0T2_9BACI